MHLFDSPLVRRLLWNLLPLAVVLFAVSTTLMGDEGLLRRHTVKQQLYARQDQVARLEAENAALAAEVRHLRRDRRVLTRAVAEELLLAEPGTTVYRFEQ